MLRSLWFRLTGTVVTLVILTLGLSLVATLVIAGRQLSEFIDNTSDEIIQITAPTELINGPTEGAGNEAIVIDGPNGPIIEIDPDGTFIVNAEDPDLSQIEVQIPQIVRSQSVQLAQDVQTTILSAAGVSALLAVIAGTWLFWQITRPLARLRVAAESVASGDLDTRVRIKSKDEVGRVGLAFNHMAGELQRQEGLRQQMVADIAHELRTPLTVMQANLEAMGDDLLPASPEELGGLHHEVLRLSRLVEDLRVISLADAGKLQLYGDLIDANDLITTATRRLKPQADALGIVLQTVPSVKPALIDGDEDKLHQVFANLISNSLRFTPAGKSITVSAKADRKQVTLQVRDQGPGIDPAQLPDLFERFYKGDRSRSRTDAGSGLGLSIVKQLVELHNGQVKASLPAGGGLQITISLPRQLS